MQILNINIVSLQIVAVKPKRSTLEFLTFRFLYKVLLSDIIIHVLIVRFWSCSGCNVQVAIPGQTAQRYLQTYRGQHRQNNHQLLSLNCQLFLGFSFRTFYRLWPQRQGEAQRAGGLAQLSPAEYHWKANWKWPHRLLEASLVTGDTVQWWYTVAVTRDCVKVMNLGTTGHRQRTGERKNSGTTRV